MSWLLAVGILTVAVIVWGLIRLYRIDRYEKIMAERLQALRTGRR